MQKISIGNEVEWTWGRGKARGKVAQKFTSDVERRIKGKVIKRKASVDEPACLVNQEGDRWALKSRSELEKRHG
ncbi:hypervirulence associated TUDOR domain-containing protein [Rhizobium terrae]|uniref:DUF2945 domain-containing protein n=1 Tax=Rhizobium terrae TaxID=2171756 RepID=UPI000E3E1C73|nr:DUF2945 domain-containing protein [Rhizobium terrae]